MKKQASTTNSKKAEPTFWEWFWHGKGTVSEEWTTPEELMARPEIVAEVNQVSKQLDEYLEIRGNQTSNGRSE